jgi:chromate transporter
MLPGPMFNISLYVGGVMDGWRGAILCYLALFAPAFFMIWGILPYWNTYREKPLIKNFLRGMGIVAIGFIWVAALLLYKMSIS